MAHHEFTLSSGEVARVDIPQPLTPDDKATLVRWYELIMQCVPLAHETDPLPTPRQSPAERAVEEERDYINEDEGLQQWRAMRRRRR
jgi:hypothetical protein